MALAPLLLGLGSLFPVLVDALTILAGIVTLRGEAQSLAEGLTGARGGSTQERVTGLGKIDQVLSPILTSPEFQAAVATAGTDALTITARYRARLQELIDNEFTTQVLSFYHDQAEVDGFRTFLGNALGAGFIDLEQFNAGNRWATNEEIRLKVGVTETAARGSPDFARSLLDLPTFATIADVGSFTSEAQGLFEDGRITQAGLSRLYAHAQSEITRLMGAPRAAAPPLAAQPVAGGAPAPAALPTDTTRAIADLRATLTQLQASGQLTKAQNDAISQQIAALTAVAARPAPTTLDFPGFSPAIEGLGVILATQLPNVLAGSLSTALVQTAGVSAHNAQRARYDCMSSFLDPLLSVAGRLAPQIAAGVILSTDNPIRQALDRLIEEIITGELSTAQFSAPTNYDEAVGNAASRLRQAVTFGMTAQAISYTAEAMTPLKQLGFGQLAGFFGELAGFSRIASGLMGTIETAAIYRPLQYEAQRKFRPTIPNGSELAVMFQKRSLTREELRDFQERLGYPDLYIERLPGFIFNDPNPALIIRAFQIAEPAQVTLRDEDREILRIAGIREDDPDLYIKLKLAKGGLDDLDVQAFTPVIKMGILRREQTLRYGQIERLFRDGFITRDRAREEILQARVPTAVLDYRLAAMDLEREYEILADSQQLIMESLSRGIISVDEAESSLTGLGMDGRRVHLAVLRARLKLAPRSAVAITAPVTEQAPVIGGVEE